jgi:hypothetical protein
MTDLERELAELRVQWPPTPDIALAVRERLAAPEHAGRAPRALPRLLRGRRALAGALAVLVACAGGLAASPAARSAILEFLGLKGAKIERREPNAPPPPPRRQDLGADLGLGRVTTLEQARQAAGFRVVVPGLDPLGAPDAVYFQDERPEGGRVSLVYGPRPGIARADTTGAGVLITEFRAQVTPLIQKSAGSATRVRRLTVDGQPAFFLAGAHGFAYLGEGDSADYEDQRLAGNTLLVERGGLLLRIEGDLSQAAAVRIARSTR